MAPRPFPFALRVGTDICSVRRIRALITGGAGTSVLDRFLKRILTDPERTYFWARFGAHHTTQSWSEKVSTYLAGRFAAKEAIRKACDHLDKQSRGLQRIMILPISSERGTKHASQRPKGLILDEDYKPPAGTADAEGSTEAITEANIAGQRVDINALEGQLCEISISHDGDYATAVALVPTALRTTGTDNGGSEM